MVNRVFRGALWCAVLLLAGTAQAGIFLRFEDPAIDGESTVKGFEKQVVVTSYAQSIQNSGTILGGGGSTGKAVPSSIAITKPLDKSSTTLLLKLNQGAHLNRMSFSLTVNDGTGEKICMKVLVEQVIVKKVSLDASADSRLEETVEFEFGRITWTYYPTPGDTSVSTQSSWDYTTNTP